MYKYQKDDLIIRKPKEEKINEKNKNHLVYARVVDVDRKADTIVLDRYLKEGRLRLDIEWPPKLPLSRLENENYYQKMNDDEIMRFRDGLMELNDSWFFDNEYVRATFEVVNELAEKIEREMNSDEKDIELA